MADGLSLHGRESPLVIVEQQSLLSEMIEQCFELSVLELNDLLLRLVDQAAEAGQQNVSGLDDERHVRRRKSTSVGYRQMKSSD